MNRVILITAILLQLGCQQSTDTSITFSAKNKTEENTINSALFALKKQCGPLFEQDGWQDVVQASAINEELFYWQRDRNWQGQVIVTVQFNNDIDSQVAGHSCAYMIDTGLTEISVAKDVCMQLCDIPTTGNGDNGYARLDSTDQ